MSETSEPWVPDPEARPTYGDETQPVGDKVCEEFTPDPDGTLTFGGGPACATCGYSERRHAR